MRAHLTHHLNRNLNRLPHGLRRIEFRPRLIVDRAFLTQRLVEELLGPMRHNRCQHGDDVMRHTPAQSTATLAFIGSIYVFAGRVRKLHDGRDCRIELAAIKIRCAFHPRGVQNTVQLGRFVLKIRDNELFMGIGRLGKQPNDTPRAPQEAVGPLNCLRIPIKVFLGRRNEKNAEAHGVCTVWLNDRAWRDHIALRFTHHVAMLVFDHSLAQKVGERLVNVY